MRVMSAIVPVWCVYVILQATVRLETGSKHTHKHIALSQTYLKCVKLFSRRWVGQREKWILAESLKFGGLLPLFVIVAGAAVMYVVGCVRRRRRHRLICTRPVDICCVRLILYCCELWAYFIDRWVSVLEEIWTLMTRRPYFGIAVRNTRALQNPSILFICSLFLSFFRPAHSPASH